MKVTRHAKILELITSRDIETQEELAEELRKSGMNVTQATVSRDIKELKLIKVLSSNGKYKYSTISHTENYLSNKLVNIFSQSVVTVENVSNFVVIKTLSGSASAAAEAIDSLNFEGIAGSLAGDNTIFVMTRTNEQAIEITQRMKKMITE
ncbi:transcriptional regulator of arginine metabolism [Clostridium tetanomorphum]|uniref:Arginine repressor n=1 Tax=Clostridium tetanomorphum TaxID=1553 RepID=A0A923IZE7_CLOTT|nr:arginine repressor [Clostridium tetanomorphum]KAJ51470.1 arginine repressor [Clostridium tetanomorphum DSM 665]MBC2396564.1 arginine repressor [Clostridium tetanomorphum]MBP1863891.1 transcriptional regulator of arginine metabolism [Clostridium tetanomorphum]NRS84969.1 transcriptional regulator of arginine metabolism [Clostridium tetanomorphum]NRZ98185.1 transcriptional regulator of arginine metabolism [Clostridium tetanomorphum]